MGDSHIPTYKLTFTFSHVPQVMKRGEHVLIVVKDQNGNYFLGGKSIYPNNIYRFIGGGTDGEDPKIAALRELEEEIGDITINPKNILKIAQISAAIKESSTGTEYHFVTHMFSYLIQPEDAPSPQSDLDQIKVLSTSEMEELIDRFYTLPNDLATLPKGEHNPQATFRWSDYGTFYGKVHQIGFDLTTNLN